MVIFVDGTDVGDYECRTMIDGTPRAASVVLYGRMRGLFEPLSLVRRNFCEHNFLIKVGLFNYYKHD